MMQIHCRKFLSIILFAIFCLSPVISGRVCATETEGGKSPFLLSPTVSWYLPTDGKTKDTFGSTWSGFGASLNMEALGWKKPGWEVGSLTLRPFVGYYRADHRDNDAHIVPLGIETLWTRPESGKFQPYAGLGLFVSPIKFEDRDAGVKTGWKAAAGGRVVLGADINKWLNVQAAYHLMSEVEGYDFSGFSIAAKITFYF